MLTELFHEAVFEYGARIVQSAVYRFRNSMLESIIDLIVTIYMQVTPKNQSCIRMQRHLQNDVLILIYE